MSNIFENSQFLERFLSCIDQNFKTIAKTLGEGGRWTQGSIPNLKFMIKMMAKSPSKWERVEF